jgi:hypothetical protein
MTRIITTFALLICSTVFAQNSTFNQGMEKAFGIWKQDKPQDAAAIFERISTVEKTNWLPDYYVALINTTEVFKSQDVEKNTLMIEKAQKALDNAKLKSTNNAEIHVLQALIYTATLVQDPMSNGMKYSPMVMKEYQTALAIAPNNPRAVFGRAEFELGGAKWSGASTKPICEEITRSIELFNNFKPESAFYPDWGKERALEAQKTCK